MSDFFSSPKQLEDKRIAKNHPVSEFKRDSDDSDDERSIKSDHKVLQLSSLKIYAPAEGFLLFYLFRISQSFIQLFLFFFFLGFGVLREINLTRSGANDFDIDKIAMVIVC